MGRQYCRALRPRTTTTTTMADTEPTAVEGPRRSRLSLWRTRRLRRWPRWPRPRLLVARSRRLRKLLTLRLLLKTLQQKRQRLLSNFSAEYKEQFAVPLNIHNQNNQLKYT